MKILFVDPTCPKPYDPKALLEQPLGGTEATVIRIAEEFAAQGHTVRVAQHNRQEVAQFGAEYVGFGQNLDFKPTHVVVLRAPLVLRTARKQYPSAKLYLWCHDIIQGEAWAAGFQAVVDTQTVPIFVSDWHRNNFYDTATSINFKGVMPGRRIYNPIADDLRPDATPVDKDKLLFFSSPHKGLEHTLGIFKNFANFKELENIKLYVANPGYFPSTDLTGLKNVVQLGSLTHADVISQLRSALGVLHLNPDFPETFGLVHAEACAVGTPFLSSRLGATAELADHPSLLIDVKDPRQVIDRMIQWRTVDRPRVRGNIQFRMTQVRKQWEELLKL